MYRKGIVLLITLSLISLISLVVMRGFDLMKKGFQHIEAVEKINQTKVVLSDLEAILITLTKHIKDSATLDMFLGDYPPISDENGLFSLTFGLERYPTALNINDILQEQNRSTPDVVPQIKEIYLPVFEYIFNRYEVRDGEYLLNLILDTLDSDGVERGLGTEIVLNDVSFLNGLIVSRQQFQTILKEYQAQTDDNSVFEIPWEKYFYFSYSKEKTIIDCSLVSSELAKALGFEIYMESENSDEVEEEISCEMLDDKEKMKDYNIEDFNISKTHYLRGSVNYSTNIVEDSFDFIFNLKTKRIVDVRESN